MYVVKTVLLLAFCRLCLGNIHPLPASEVRDKHQIHFRSNALSKKVVFLIGYETINFYFCLKKTSTVKISSLRYSNGNDPEVITAVLNHKNLGSVVTISPEKAGDNWNVFHSSSEMKGSVILERGWYILKLQVHGSDGVELDTVSLDIDDSSLAQDMLECKLHCTSDLPHLNSSPRINVDKKAKLRQKSYPSKCAEEDNVKIPVFLDSVKEYKLIATLPVYKAFLNRREPNNTHCVALSPLYWSFTHLCLNKTNNHLFSSSATLKVYPGPDTSKIAVIEISFMLKGRSEGYIDADIGSVFSLKIKPVTSFVKIQVSYIDRNKNLVSLKEAGLKPGESDVEWQIPNFSWIEHNVNLIQILLSAQDVFSICMEEIKLARKPMKPEKHFPIYTSNEFTVIGVDVDFWWRTPETMKVYVKNTDKLYRKVDYFKIILPVPWSEGYSETLVIYQDGNVRLLPLPPAGLDWIPFGTSVVVGTCDVDLIRPAAPIDQVDIDVDKRELKILYRNGEKAKLTLISKVDRTELVVSDLMFKQSSKGFPFATFRSMYVDAGNTDSDSIMVDSSSVFGVMENLNGVHGKTFTLFRRCESKHLTLSPDIHLELLRTR